MKREKELQEERRSLLNDQVSFLKSNYDEKKGWKNPEDEKKFSAMEDDLMKFDKNIEMSKAFYEKQAQLAEDNLLMKELKIEGSAEENEKVRKEKYNKAFTKFMVHGGEGLNAEEKKTLSQGQVSIKGTSPQTTTDSAGGYTVPEGWLGELDVARQAIGSVRQAARILTTATGNTIPYPKVDDTGTDAELQTEGSAITVADMTFTNVNIGAYTMGTLAKVSYQLETDTDVPLQMVLNDLFGERVARKENSYFTSGTGSSQPHGVTAVATTGTNTTTKDVIVVDDVYNLIHSVDPAYRYNPKAGFMFHDNILKILKKLSVGSGDDRPLWVPSFRDGEPDRIDGRQYWINQNMVSDITAGGKVMLYGDFNKFLIRQVGSGVVMQRLVERYADELNIGYVAHLRVDSRLVGTSGCIKYMYNEAT